MDVSGTGPSTPETRRPCAVVTGAAGDLGKRLCGAFAEADWAVAALDVAEPATVVENLLARDVPALGANVDLTEPEPVREAFEEIGTRFSGVDALVNNAGLFHGVPRVPFWEIDVDSWRRVLDTNLTSTFLATRYALPLLRARRGRVVNLSSSTAAFGMPNYLHYVTSKAGVVGMTRAMARELGPYGIAVNAVAPGLTNTEGNVAELPEQYWSEVAAEQCLAEPVRPEQVVAAIMTLCAPGAGMSGQTVVVNNGATVGPF